jgi:hypothetical protein
VRPHVAIDVLLDLGVLVEHVQGDQLAVPVDLGLEPAAGRRQDGAAEAPAAAEQQLDVFGRPRSMFSASSVSKNARAWTSSPKTRVRETSTCRSTAPARTRHPGRRRSAAAGAWPSTARTTPARCRGRTGRRCPGGRPDHRRSEPVGQRSEPDPRLGGLPPGPLMTVHPDLDRIGEVGADLDEPRPICSSKM